MHAAPVGTEVLFTHLHLLALMQGEVQDLIGTGEVAEAQNAF